MKKLIVFISILFIGFASAGCTKQQSQNTSTEKTAIQNGTITSVKIESTNDLINSLKKSNYKIDSATQEKSMFLKGSLTAIKTGTDIISVYEYKDNQQMETDSKTISSDGSRVGNAIVDWTNLPHFYKSGNILVIYVGNNNEMIEALKKLLGKQFAGA